MSNQNKYILLKLLRFLRKKRKNFFNALYANAIQENRNKPLNLDRLEAILRKTNEKKKILFCFSKLLLGKFSTICKLKGYTLYFFRASLGFIELVSKENKLINFVELDKKILDEDFNKFLILK